MADSVRRLSLFLVAVGGLFGPASGRGRHLGSLAARVSNQRVCGPAIDASVTMIGVPMGA